MNDKFNREWALSQLAAAQVNLPVGNAIVKLIDAWESSPEMKDVEQTKEALKLFVMLAQGQPIVEDLDQWEPAEAGFTLTTGQIVRVSPSAYVGNLGRIHNGRLVKVVARRWGNIIVDSVDGKMPELRSAHYPSNVLQVRKK